MFIDENAYKMCTTTWQLFCLDLKFFNMENNIAQ